MADIKLTMFFKKYKILIRSCALNSIVCACIVREHIQTFVFCVSHYFGVHLNSVYARWLLLLYSIRNTTSHTILYYIAINFRLLLWRCHRCWLLHKQGYFPWALLHLLPYHWERTSWSGCGMESFWNTCVRLSAINYTYIIEWDPTSHLQLAVPYTGWLLSPSHANILIIQACKIGHTLYYII